MDRATASRLETYWYTLRELAFDPCDPRFEDVLLGIIPKWGLPISAEDILDELRKKQNRHKEI